MFFEILQMYHRFNNRDDGLFVADVRGVSCDTLRKFILLLFFSLTAHNWQKWKRVPDMSLP